MCHSLHVYVTRCSSSAFRNLAETQFGKMCMYVGGSTIIAKGDVAALLVKEKIVDPNFTFMEAVGKFVKSCWRLASW